MCDETYISVTGRSCPSHWARVELPIRIFDPLLRALTAHAPPLGPWLFPGRSSGNILRPRNEIYRRNGSLKYEPRGLGTNAPGYWENTLILVCTPSFGYQTPVVTQLEQLHRHISWPAGPQLSQPPPVGGVTSTGQLPPSWPHQGAPCAA